MDPSGTDRIRLPGLDLTGIVRPDTEPELDPELEPVLELDSDPDPDSEL